MMRAAWRVAGKKSGARKLWFQKTGRDAIVAIELDIIEGCGDAKPAGHGRGLYSTYARHRFHDDVAETQGFADQHDFQFDRSSNCKLPGAQKINAGRAYVAGDKGYRKFLGHAASTAKTQRKVQSGTGVFPVFRMHAYGVRRYPDETPRLRRDQKRCHAKGRYARRIRQRLRPQRSFASLRGWLDWPRFKRSYTIRRAHEALRDATSLSQAMAQQTKPQNG